MSVAAPLPPVDVLQQRQERHGSMNAAQGPTVGSVPEQQSIPSLDDLIHRYKASRPGQSALSQEDQQKAAQAFARLRQDPRQISRMLGQRQRPPSNAAGDSEVSPSERSDAQNSDVEAVVVSPEAQKRQQQQEETSTFGTVSTDDTSTACSQAESVNAEGKQADAHEKEVSPADTKSSGMDSRFKGYQPSAPGVNPVKNRMTIEDLRRLQQQHKDGSTMSTSAQNDQGAMSRFQPPQLSGQDQTTVDTAAPTDTAMTVQPKGRAKRSLDSMRNRLKGLVRRDSMTDAAATNSSGETGIDYATLLGERDAEITTLKSRIKDANTRVFDLESEFGKFRQTAAEHLSEITDMFKRQMSDMEDKHKAEREEMMALTKGLRSEIEQLRAEMKGPAGTTTVIDKAATESDVGETIDEADKQVQLYRPETDQSTGDLSTAMTGPSLRSLQHPRFQQIRPPPMPSFFCGPHPSSSFGGFSPFAPRSMMPFHHPAGMLSSFAPPSMGFRPSPFGFAPSFGHPMMMLPAMSSTMQPPSRRMPSFDAPSFGGFTDDMGIGIGAGSALTNLQSKLSEAMMQATKDGDDMTTASVSDNGSEATEFFRRLPNGYVRGQGFKLGEGGMMTSSMSSVSHS